MSTLGLTSATPGTRHDRVWLRVILETSPDWVPALQRVTLGGVILAHGAQKALGWFGGGGVSATLAFFRDVLHLPSPIGLFVIASDFVGSLMLLTGAFTRASALAAGAVMLGAIFSVHAANGFFMNWFGTQAGEGFEFHLLALALAAALIARGGGRASLDRYWAEKLAARA
jgi:putative oxidoreductase